MSCYINILCLLRYVILSDVLYGVFFTWFDACSDFIYCPAIYLISKLQCMYFKNK